MPRSYTDLTLKTLFMLAGHYCAFPGCTNRTFEVPNTRTPVVLGEIAHIRASADSGPRADSSLTPQERDSYENLLVLCAYHHGLVDKLDSEYTVADLVAWKAAAELATSDRLSAGNSGVTFLELELVCQAFADGVVGAASTAMVAVAPADKMAANQLSGRITTFMVTGLAHAPMVADYVRRQAQINPNSHVTKDTWRNPTGIAAAYFAQLVEWGYAASEVEQIVLDAATEKTAESNAAETAEERISE